MFKCQFDKIHPYTNASSASLLLVHEHMALPYSPYLSLGEFHYVKSRRVTDAHSRVYTWVWFRENCLFDSGLQALSNSFLDSFFHCATRIPSEVCAYKCRFYASLSWYGDSTRYSKPFWLPR